MVQVILHPEVKYVGFVTPLYAGTTSLFNFKHFSAASAIVKNLKRWSRSAGNLRFEGSSETTRGANTENVRPISEHLPGDGWDEITKLKGSMNRSANIDVIEDIVLTET